MFIFLISCLEKKESLAASQPEFVASRLISSTSSSFSDDFAKNSSMPRDRNHNEEENVQKRKTDVPSIESTFEALKKAISVPGDISSSSRDPSLEVFDSIRAHFEQIRKAIDHLDPQKTLEAATSSTGSTDSTTSSTSSFDDWLKSITSLTQSVPLVHQAIQLVSNQIRNIRDRLTGSTIRSYPLNGNSDLQVWADSFEKVAKQFGEIQTAWHDVILKGVPLLLSLSYSLQPDYYFLDSPEESGVDGPVGGGDTISRQEDIFLPSSIKDIMAHIDETRKIIRDNIRNTLKRGSAVNGHLPGRAQEWKPFDPSKRAPQDKKSATLTSTVASDSRNRNVEYNVNTAVTETVGQLQRSFQYLTDLYIKVFANYVSALSQSTIGQQTRRQGKGVDERDISIDNPITEIQTPVPGSPFHGSDGFPYDSFNFFRILNRNFLALVDLLTRLSRIGPIELPG